MPQGSRKKMDKQEGEIVIDMGAFSFFALSSA
jgi:hypothetical protein